MLSFLIDLLLGLATPIVQFLSIIGRLVGGFLVTLIILSLLYIWVVRRVSFPIPNPFLGPAIGALIGGFITQRLIEWPLSREQAVFAYLGIVALSIGCGLGSVTAGWIFQRKWVIERLSRPPPED